MTLGGDPSTDAASAAASPGFLPENGAARLGVGSPSCLGVLGAVLRGEADASAPRGVALPALRGVVSTDDSMDAFVRLMAPPRTMLSMAARDCRKVARLPSMGCAKSATKSRSRLTCLKK